ncbi:MAG: rhomboid family intramembrane serine protease [Haloferula sp.]
MLNTHWPLLLVMLVMLVILMFQGILGELWYAPYMMYPVDVALAWEHATSGSLEEGDLWAFASMLTAGLFHGDLVHWGSNMIFMWLFGSLLGGLIGYRATLLILFSSIVGGSACDAFLRSAEIIPCLGASGGVMGLEGAYLGLALRYHLPDPQTWPLARPVAPVQLVIFALIGVAFDMKGLTDGLGQVAYGAHLGGFVTGVTLTGLILPFRKTALVRRS